MKYVRRADENMMLRYYVCISKMMTFRQCVWVQTLTLFLTSLSLSLSSDPSSYQPGVSALMKIHTRFSFPLSILSLNLYSYIILENKSYFFVKTNTFNRPTLFIYFSHYEQDFSVYIEIFIYLFIFSIPQTVSGLQSFGVVIFLLLLLTVYADRDTSCICFTLKAFYQFKRYISQLNHMCVILYTHVI